MRRAIVPLFMLIVAVAALASCGTTGLPRPGTLPARVKMAGRWNSNWGLMELKQEGDQLSGPFDHCEGCLITGTLDGDLFLFKWVQPGNINLAKATVSGRGWMRVHQDGNIMDGLWGYGESHEGGGRWKATRINR